MAGNFKISENLMLRRVDPTDILKKYLAGEYKDYNISKNMVAMSNSFKNVHNNIGANQTFEIYKLNNKTSHGQIIVTTNHGQYNYNKQANSASTTTNTTNTTTTKNNEKRPLAFCIWCRREIEGTPLGIPISMEIDKYQNRTIFAVENTFDTFGCALAMVKKIYGCNRMYKDPLYMDTEQLLHCMYYAMYPDKVDKRIEEAKDWRLLHCNGGPLSDNEYDSQKYQYIPMPSVVLSPIKRQYVKLSLNSKK